MKFSKELYAASRPWKYNYAFCIIKTERTSPANCEPPCLHHKEVAKCTLEGSRQSNWEGCLSPELLSKYCPWVRNWRTCQRPIDSSCLGMMSRSSVTLGAGVDWSLMARLAQVLLLGSFRPVTRHYVVAFICSESLNSHTKVQSIRPRCKHILDIKDYKEDSSACSSVSSQARLSLELSL